MPCHWDIARRLQTCGDRYHLVGVWPLPPLESGSQGQRKLWMSGAFLLFSRLPPGLRQGLPGSPPYS